MATTNLTAGGHGTQMTFEELICSSSYVGRLQKQQSNYMSAIILLLSVTAFLGNSLILAALHKESSLHPPSKLLYRCLATTDLLVGLVSLPLYATYWISVAQENWGLCRHARDTAFIASYTLCSVSLLTMTAISVDRLLALLLGLRYRQIVTLKRTGIIVATFWILSHPNVLNIARYRKAVYSALWVQLALVVCYLPFNSVVIVMSYSKTYPSHLVFIREVGVVLVYLNSTLNPILYCWKVCEVRQSVKQLIRQALCYSWS
ncbi:adenosine receptor A2b-like [Stylophora pistillata]|uniref:adenosine receptor A2b-like n=1 Tax=Stylophora pistillata TaxID=50429 RepID=UPI000C04364C|nr:adenosine receptor A2b-like [Stylophora pistillata]